MSTVTVGLSVLDLPLESLHADEDFNCRGAITPSSVIDLARSLEEQGLQNPITVQPYKPEQILATGKQYRIVSGYRRFMSARVLKWPTIPCIVRADLTDAEARLLNLGENLHRKELNILQEAKALYNLKMAGMGQEEVARKLDQSRGWVQVRYYLLEMPEEIQQEAAAGLLTQTQVRELYTMPTNRQRFEAVKQIKDARIRGDKTPKVIKAKKTSIYARKPRERSEIFGMMDHIQSTFGNNFGTRCLAWAAGEISDLDLYTDLSKLAGEKGLNYAIPKETMPSVQERAYAGSAK